MYLQEIHLKNICQHVDLSYSFEPGMTGILGRNGTGKTNLLQAVKTSLTGDFSAIHGKRGVINRLAGEKEPAFIRATWRHAGSVFEVLRSVRPDETVLTIGGQSISSVTRVQAELERILEVNTRIIDDYVFVDQGQVTGFLSQQPSERSKAFMYLCGVHRAEKIYQLLGKRLRDDQQLLVPIDESEVDALRTEAREMKQRAAELQAQRAAMESHLISTEEQQRLEVVLADIERKKQKQQELATAKLERQKAETSLNSAAALLADIEASLAATPVAVDLVDMKIDLAALETQAEKYKRKQDLQAKLPSRPAPVPEPPEGYRNSRELMQQLRQETGLLAEVQSKLEQLAAEGTIACPTCGTPVVNLHAEIDRLRAESLRLPGRQKLLAERIKAYEAYEKLRDSRLAGMERYTAAVNTIKQQLAELGDVEEVDKARLQSLQDALSAEEQNSKDRQKLQQQQASAAATVKERESQLRVKQAAVANLVQTLAEIVVEEDADSCSQRLTQHKNAAAGLPLILQSQKDLHGRRLRVKTRLDTIARQRAGSAGLRSWLEDLESYQGHLHHSALPRDVTMAMLIELEDRTNDVLGRFDCPFRVTAGDELLFVVQHHDGTQEQATSLSGGQKVVLAMAFRLAVYDMFAAHLGLLVLDEPTAGLDSDNLDMLIEVLQQLASEARKQDWQILLVTHDTRLSRAMDHVLDLNSWPVKS